MVGSSYVLEKKKTKIQQAKNMGNTTPFQHTPLFVGWKVFSTIFPESWFPLWSLKRHELTFRLGTFKDASEGDSQKFTPIIEALWRELQNTLEKVKLWNLFTSFYPPQV